MLKKTLKCFSLLAAVTTCAATVYFPKSDRRPDGVEGDALPAPPTSGRDRTAGYDIPVSYVEMPADLPAVSRGEHIVFDPPVRDGSPARAEVHCVVADVIEHSGGSSRTLKGFISSLEEPEGDCIITCGVLAAGGVSCIGNARPNYLLITQYEIRPVAGTSYHVVKEVPYAVYEDDSAGADQRQSATPGLRGIHQTNGRRKLADTNDIMDVMVVYTPAAMASAGGAEAMDILLKLAFDESNDIFERSDVSLRLRLVHSMLMLDTTYVDTGSLATVLSEATYTGGSNAAFDTEQNLRYDKKADALVVVTDSGDYCGIAWLNAGGTADLQVSVTAYNCATGYYSFVHELGHNLGATHDLSASSHGGGEYYYSHGYCWDRSSSSSCDGSCRRSVMAYASCSSATYGCTSCTRYPYFSNPDISEAGSATGVADVNDNARTIDQTKAHAIALQDSLQEGGMIFSVVPSEADAANPNTQVEIKGWRIGGGSDISQVTLAGVPVSSIVSQTADSVIVVPGTASGPRTGDVRVLQSGSGEYSTLAGIFSYTGSGTGGSSVTFPLGDISPATCEYYGDRDSASGLEYNFGKKRMKNGKLFFFTELAVTKNKLKRGKTDIKVALLSGTTTLFETTADLYKGSDVVNIDYSKLEFSARGQVFTLAYELNPENTGEFDIGSDSTYVEVQVTEVNSGSDVVQECVRFKVNTEAAA